MNYLVFNLTGSNRKAKKKKSYVFLSLQKVALDGPGLGSVVPRIQVSSLYCSSVRGLIP